MTSEKLYEIELGRKITEYETSYLNPLNNFKTIPPAPTELAELLKYKKNLTRCLNQLLSIKVPTFNFDPTEVINRHYDDLDKKLEEKRNKLISESSNKKKKMIEEHDNKIREIAQYNEGLTEPLKDKHNELLSRKEEIAPIFEHYDITPLDIDITDKVTIDEFGTLIDESLSICSKYMRKDSAIFNKLTNPLQQGSDKYFAIAYVLLALVILYLLLPAFSVPVFVIFFLSVHNMYKDREKLCIACSLMSQIDYKRFIPESSFKEVDDVDVGTVDAELQYNLSHIGTNDKSREADLEDARNDMDVIKARCDKAYKKVSDEYNICVTRFKNHLQKTEETIDKLLSEYKPFPTVHNNSVVMSHRYVVGRIEDSIDVSVDVPPTNLVFDATDRISAINNVKLYLANVILNVRVKQLTVEIFDPKDMCKEFTEFFTQETRPYIKPNSMKLEELNEHYRKLTQENIIALKNVHIDDFNKDAEERELVPKEYKLLIIVSEFSKLEDGDQKELFMSYFTFSANSGVRIWLLDTKSWPGSTFVTGAYDREGAPIIYNPSIGDMAVKTFSDSLKDYKDTGINYKEKFGDVYIPRDKWWSWDTIKEIWMPFGLEDGDPTRGLNVAPKIYDGNVHALLGGATGAGKSAAINQLLISLITMYPPSELMIILIDFKNVEAAKFTRGYLQDTNSWMDPKTEEKMRGDMSYYTRLSRIPHLKIISGTTDGEYALSVFEYLMDEMARRQSINNQFGKTKFEEVRKEILSRYNSEHGTKCSWLEMRNDWDWYKENVYDKYGDMPRLLVIFDEFQVMFNPEFVENKVIEQINGKITAFTKLARAMSAHFWFTSQSMKGTMSKDTMGNFSLRGALRCDSAVSDELLGNNAASTITAKFGFMYTNDSAGTDKNANRLWRVPFLHEDDIPSYIDPMYEMMEERHEFHRMAEFYDEKVLVPSSVLDDWYNNYPDKFEGPDYFIIGERAGYSTNKAPATMGIQHDGGENILLAAFEKSDLLNLIMTMVTNLKHTKDATILMNIQDKETYTMLDPESFLEEQFVDMASPNFDMNELLDSLEMMIAHREEVGGPYSYVYMFCVQWERAPLISVETAFKAQDKFKDLMRRGPVVGVHFIMALREKLDCPKFITVSCNHKLCGLIPKDSFFFTETSKVEKLPSASKGAGLFAIYTFGTTMIKVRIYQHVFTKQIASREIVL